MASHLRGSWLRDKSSNPASVGDIDELFHWLFSSDLEISLCNAFMITVLGSLGNKPQPVLDVSISATCIISVPLIKRILD